MSPTPPESPGALGLLAGGGEVPVRLARAALNAGRPVFVVVLEGQGNAADYAGIPHGVFRMGGVAAILSALHEHGVKQLVLCGRVSRPSFSALRLDATGIRLAARMGSAFLMGDDGLLRALVKLLEQEGLHVVSQAEALRSLLPPAGPLTTHRPDDVALQDIARGVAVVRALGQLDVGQGAVVQQGLVLAVEAIEGTDAMLARCGPLRREGPGGVLVKLVKPGQDRRIDLPTIGPRTIANAAAAGLRGIAMEAEGTILVDQEATVVAAEEAGLFLLAIRPAEHTPEEKAP